MVRALALIGMALAGSGCGRPATLPTGFHGAWEMEVADCGDPESQTGLTVTEHRLQAYESGGDIVTLSISGNGRANVTLAWSDVNVELPDGTPQTQEKAASLRLSEDESRLVFRMDGESVAYVRCVQDRM